MKLGQASQVPRQADPESSPGTSANPLSIARTLRHAASANELLPTAKTVKPARNQDLKPVSRAGDLAETNSKLNLIALIEETDFWKGRDRPGLIRMKRADAAGTGAADSVYRLAALTLIREPKLGFNNRLKLHSTLIRQEDGRCLLKDAKTEEMSAPVDGQRYLFVTMPGEGPLAEIRVCRKTAAGSGHAQVSGNAPYVRYAGEVMFKDGREVHATPQSGTYLPPLDKARAFSGLNCEFSSEFPSNPGQAKWTKAL